MLPKEIVIIHPGRPTGGFGKRLGLLIEALQKRVSVRVLSKGFDLRHLLSLDRGCHGGVCVLFFTSLLMPCVALLKLARQRLSVYYLVRGDEITFAVHDKRYLRALIAYLFQLGIAHLDCTMVFVSADLQELFRERYGEQIVWRSLILPNSIGRSLPSTRPFDGRIGLVGDFHTVKNIEWVIRRLESGRFKVHLYGNTGFAEQWERSWLHAHGVVPNLTDCLCKSCSLVILADTSAGFPNVLVEALQAGCSVVVHQEFPFRCLPIDDAWRFDLTAPQRRAKESQLERVLLRLLHEKRDFREDNPGLVGLVESDWEARIWEIFR